MSHQNSSRNILLIWEYSSHEKSIVSYDKTKIPLKFHKSSQGEINTRTADIFGS